MMKKTILKAVAKIAKKSAILGANSASQFGYHQAREPKNLKSIIKNIK